MPLGYQPLGTVHLEGYAMVSDHAWQAQQGPKTTCWMLEIEHLQERGFPGLRGVLRDVKIVYMHVA